MHQQHALQRTVRRWERPQTGHEPAIASILAAQSVLDLAACLRRLDEAAQMVEDPLPILGVQQPGPFIEPQRQFAQGIAGLPPPFGGKKHFFGIGIPFPEGQFADFSHQIQPRLGFVEFLLAAFACVDVDQDEAIGWRITCRRGGKAGLQPNPDRTRLGAPQAQLAGLWLVGGPKLVAEVVMDVLIVGDDELSQGCVDQGVTRGAEELGGGEVDLLDQPRLAQGQIPDRSQIVEVEVARSRTLQRCLGAAQLIVLQLQLDLMHTQFVDQSFGRLGYKIAPRLRRFRRES